MPYLGESLTRREDTRLVNGTGTFVADLRVAGCLEAAFRRSPLAHGRVLAVRPDPARRLPGVTAAWSAADLGPLPTPAGLDPAVVRDRPWPALATDRVRYAGEPVAVVLAADRYLAEDGCDAVEVDLEPLPALLDPTEAAGSAVELFPGASNVAAEREFGRPVPADVWRDAAVVVEAAYRQQLLAHTSLEARAILASPEPGEELTVWCSHQAPHRLRRDLAAVFGLEPARVRVVVPDVGGAFGGKSQTYPEYLAVVAAALRLGRPVRWVEDRAEALAGPPHGRGQNQRVRLAAAADGTLLAYELDIDADIGGYPHTGAFTPMSTSMMATGAYRIPHVHVRTRAVLTTTAPTAPYRGAGRPEAAAAIERTVDLLARRLGVDPAELRRRNHIRPDAFPYRTPTGFEYDSGDYTAALDRALAAVDYRGWRAEQSRRRAGGCGRPVGIGICTYVERTGVGEEYGAVEVRPDGTLLALSGCCSTGQGHETAFPQIVAAVLDVPPELIRLVEGDTAAVPRGTGTFASRSTQVGGAALHQAATRLIDEARGRAAAACGVPVAEVGYRAGRLTAGTTTLTLAELVTATGPLRVEAVSEPPPAFPFGTHVAVVEVDPELGTPTVLRLVAVDDCGVVVNPLLVSGQGYGSVAQGLGQALYEEVRYDAAGRPATPSLLDYLLPTAAEMPALVFEEGCTPNPNTPLGAKGVGEAGCIGTPPAVLNAIADALDLADPAALPMPATPYACWTAGRDQAARQAARGAAAREPAGSRR